MSKFRLAKERISESLPKVRIFLIITHGILLDFIRTWYGRSAHLHVWTLPECKSVQLHAFYGKVHILQPVRCVCLSFNS